MAWFDLLKFGNYNLFPDSYAVDRATLYRLFRPTLTQQLTQTKTVILSLHFPAEFFVVQDLLSQWELEYELITRPLDYQWFQQNRTAPSDQAYRLYLSLAEFLIDSRFSGDESCDAPLALMLLDRHPMRSKDEALAEFAAQFPGRSEVGYFLSFEDEVITNSIDSRMLNLLLQMGANDHGLIASAMLSRRLRKMQKRAIETFATVEQPADSASQWYELNASEAPQQ
jgi:hypothetical protein